MLLGAICALLASLLLGVLSPVSMGATVTKKWNCKNYKDHHKFSMDKSTHPGHITNRVWISYRVCWPTKFADKDERPFLQVDDIYQNTVLKDYVKKGEKYDRCKSWFPGSWRGTRFKWVMWDPGNSGRSFEPATIAVPCHWSANSQVMKDFKYSQTPRFDWPAAAPQTDPKGKKGPKWEVEVTNVRHAANDWEASRTEHFRTLWK